MRSFFALLLIVMLVTFVCTEASAADYFQTELETAPRYENAPERPFNMGEKKPDVIMPEEPATLALNDEGEDNKGKKGRKGPENTPIPQKREYHRRMMDR